MWEQLSWHTFDDQAGMYLIFVPFFTPLHCEARKKERNSGQKKTLRQKKHKLQSICSFALCLAEHKPNLTGLLIYGSKLHFPIDVGD